MHDDLLILLVASFFSLIICLLIARSIFGISWILKNLEYQSDVLKEIAKANKVDPEVLEGIEKRIFR